MLFVGLMFYGRYLGINNVRCEAGRVGRGRLGESFTLKSVDTCMVAMSVTFVCRDDPYASEMLTKPGE